MLRITKLADAEYLIGQVCRGIDDYYMGIGEAPGVWQGQLADQLGLSGVVQDDDPAGADPGPSPGNRRSAVGRSSGTAGGGL